MSKQEYIKFIERHGVNLEDKVGVKEWALKKSDALEAIQILRTLRIPNLGGDVLVENNGKFQYVHENWSSDPGTEESLEEFTKRSLTESEKYIVNYPEREPGSYYYVLVPSREALYGEGE